MGEVATIHQNALTYTGKQLDLIRRTVASDCNGTEFDLYLEVARRIGLDPFRKQIYAVIYNKDDPDKRKMSIITGIDGYRAIAARNRDYRPDENAPAFDYSETAKSIDLNPLGIVSVTVKCWKLGGDGKWYPISGIAFWEEYAPLKEIWAYDQEAGKRKPTGQYELDKKSKWYTMPRTMLAKTAEAIALRKGWPEDLAGVYVEEELEQARVKDLTASEAVEAFERDRRLQLTNAKDCVTVQWAPTDALEAVPVGQFADRAAAFVRACEAAPDLVGWEETNRVALKAFWAMAKADALELKKIIEARIKTLTDAAKIPDDGKLI